MDLLKFALSKKVWCQKGVFLYISFNSFPFNYPNGNYMLQMLKKGYRFMIRHKN